jgi:hypothetical protein
MAATHFNEVSVMIHGSCVLNGHSTSI